MEEILNLVKKHIVLIAPAFLPSNSSAAIQLSDLANEFIRQKYTITVFVPNEKQRLPCTIESKQRLKIIRLKTLKMTDVSYIRRALAEFLMPYFMIWNLRSSNKNNLKCDGIIWYSPSIFFGPFVKYIHKMNNVRTYLILRDIFPEWAVHLKLMNHGIAYYFFKYIERSQYKIASTIGVQTESNIKYFKKKFHGLPFSLEVLHNWLTFNPEKKCSIRLSLTKLSGRKIIVYAGNMGIAQNLEIFFKLAKKMSIRNDLGFLFIGRGSEKVYLEQKYYQLKNVLVLDEIDSSEIYSLFKQCHVGIVSLDKRHKIDNIPGKFISYITSGLPVLALVNKGNDLLGLVKEFDVGFATSRYSIKCLMAGLNELLSNYNHKNYIKNCMVLSGQFFSTRTAVNKICKALFK